MNSSVILTREQAENILFVYDSQMLLPEENIVTQLNSNSIQEAWEATPKYCNADGVFMADVPDVLTFLKKIGIEIE